MNANSFLVAQFYSHVDIAMAKHSFHSPFGVLAVIFTGDWRRRSVPQLNHIHPIILTLERI